MAKARAQQGRLEVPVIDIAGFAGGTVAERQAIAAQVDAAARHVGFMQITGHGIPDGVVAGLVEAIDGFFAQAAAEKQALRPASVSINRGYSGPGTERLSYSLGVKSAADLFEAFNIGTAASDFPALELPTSIYSENIWPVQAAGFRHQVESWFFHASQLARRLTQVFAVALELPADYFAAFQGHSIDVLRLNHYQLPEQGTRLEPGQMGMGAHTDYGIVTLLWADAVTPGLQVLDSDGVWHDVVPAPGALLVNLGDVLARWTNDRWISTLHRVLAPVDAQGNVIRRRSAAFFHDGNHDALISCLPGCASAEHLALYAPVTVAAHIAAKLGGSRGLKPNAEAEREAARLLGTAASA